MATNTKPCEAGLGRDRHKTTPPVSTVEVNITITSRKSKHAKWGRFVSRRPPFRRRERQLRGVRSATQSCRNAWSGRSRARIRSTARVRRVRRRCGRRYRVYSASAGRILRKLTRFAAHVSVCGRGRGDRPYNGRATNPINGASRAADREPPRPRDVRPDFMACKGIFKRSGIYYSRNAYRAYVGYATECTVWGRARRRSPC